MKYALPALLLSLAVVVLALYWPRADSFESYLGFPIGAEEFDLYVAQEMTDRGVPGLSIAILNDGEVVHHATLGYANVEAQLPVTKQTIFEGASMSKPMFGFFVMTFVEEGKLDLDQPLHAYYPHPDLEDDPRAERITARMVLSHRSGFPNWREQEDDKRLKVHFEPGTDYRYSGEGYQYLAMVLRELESTDWAGLEALFQAKVAKPLGLKNTVYVQTPYTRAYKAEPYDSDGSRIDWQNEEWFLKEDGKFFAPSSIHSEARDFARWLQALMNRELLSDESYDQLFEPHSTVPSEVAELSYTLGFTKLHIPFADLYFHTGNNVGFDAWFALDPEDGWGFVMFANSDNGEALGEELFFHLLLGTKPGLLLAAVLLSVLTLLALIVWALKATAAWRRARVPR